MNQLTINDQPYWPLIESDELARKIKQALEILGFEVMVQEVNLRATVSHLNMVAAGARIPEGHDMSKFNILEMVNEERELGIKQVLYGG